MSKTVLIPIPSSDFDPTEVSVPWKILSQAGIKVVFATPHGEPASADPVMVTGKDLGPLRLSMAADKNARHAYQDLLATHALASPIKYDELSEKDFDGLILPGGHAKGMKPYLESNLLQSVVGRFFQSNKPVGAICHGVVLASRSKVPSSSLSVLYGRKTTALPQWMELLAWNLTRTWMGDYYRTYPLTVQAEVTATLKSPHDFIRGPFSLKRDSSKHLNVGFIVRDGNYLSGRWPGDSHLFGFEFLKMLTT